MNALAFMSRQAQLDETRRAGLEAFLRYDINSINFIRSILCVWLLIYLYMYLCSSALQAVIDSTSDLAKKILAQFLDTEYHTLRMR